MGLTGVRSNSSLTKSLKKNNRCSIVLNIAMKSSAKIIFLYFILATGLTLSNTQNGFAQATPEDEDFNNLGAISYD